VRGSILQDRRDLTITLIGRGVSVMRTIDGIFLLSLDTVTLCSSEYAKHSLGWG
jgi:hypothetical protein